MDFWKSFFFHVIWIVKEAWYVFLIIADCCCLQNTVTSISSSLPVIPLLVFTYVRLTVSMNDFIVPTLCFSGPVVSWLHNSWNDLSQSPVSRKGLYPSLFVSCNLIVFFVTPLIMSLFMSDSQSLVWTFTRMIHVTSVYDLVQKHLWGFALLSERKRAFSLNGTEIKGRIIYHFQIINILKQTADLVRERERQTASYSVKYTHRGKGRKKATAV